MDNSNEKLQQQIDAAIAIQQELLDKLASGIVPGDDEKITVDICEKIVKNSLVINKFKEAVDIDNDNEKYENYLKSLDNKDIKIY